MIDKRLSCNILLVVITIIIFVSSSYHHRILFGVSFLSFSRDWQLFHHNQTSKREGEVLNDNTLLHFAFCWSITEIRVVSMTHLTHLLGDDDHHHHLNKFHVRQEDRQPRRRDQRWRLDDTDHQSILRTIRGIHFCEDRRSVERFPRLVFQATLFKTRIRGCIYYRLLWPRNFMTKEATDFLFCLKNSRQKWRSRLSVVCVSFLQLFSSVSQKNVREGTLAFFLSKKNRENCCSSSFMDE